MPERNKLVCPNCGAEMNHHATKIDYSVDDLSLVDPVFSGALKEAYTCPRCGKTELISPGQPPA